MKTKIKCLTSVFLTITMLLSIIVVAPITVNASEDDLTYGDFQYKIEDDNSCTITDYDGMASSLSIPSAINGHTVKQIDTGALSDNGIITSVTIPNGLTTIGLNFPAILILFVKMHLITQSGLIISRTVLCMSEK